ncbi:MAG TPA: hypothetical protein VKM55_26010 [Candidatus Lokiarchaeia archaeon]|nr:hypothetical protein [Candidatus Lokiarchaeia archaeon]
MESDILLWVVWGFGVFVTILVLIPLIRENRRQFNTLSHNFIILVGVLALLQGGSFVVKYILLNILGFTEPIIPINLQTDMITIFGLLAVVLHFSLYALGLRRHYGLPWIWYLFILAFLIVVGEPIDVPVISSAIIAGVLVALFLYKAIKNRNGLLFGIALYILVNLVFGVYNQYLATGNLETEICDILAFLFGNVVLALASWDVYDRYLLYDRAREKAIKSTWIAKIMQMSNLNAPKISKFSSNHHNKEQVQVQRHVTCPVCSASNTWTIANDVIQMRENSSKGVLLVAVPVGTTCDHEYSVYINHAFEIVGYKNLWT